MLIRGESIMDKTYPIGIIKYSNGEKHYCEDIVVVEAPLTIYFNANELVTLLCTPEYKEELAVGFLAASGLIKNCNNLTELEINNDKTAVWVSTSENIQTNEMFLKRYITTGCGSGTALCKNLDPLNAPIFKGNIKISIESIFKLMQNMQELSLLYKSTGGAHSAGLSDGEKILVFREDIGRHNAVDKIIGHALLNNISLQDKIILTSGRISSEIILKLAMVGVGFVISRSAPMDTAVKHAQFLNMTVAGFVRGKRMNIYSGAERIGEEI